MALLTNPEAWLAFVTLVALEVVLGIDNIVFISILADKLPPERRERIRRLGLLLAMLMRLALLAILAWLVGAACTCPRATSTSPWLSRWRSRCSTCECGAANNRVSSLEPGGGGFFSHALDSADAA